MAFVAAGIGFAVRRDARIPLFATPLRSEQIGEVAERLAEWNVAFVAAPDNVRVDARRRNELLLRLSLAGIPHPHRPTSNETLERASPLVPQSILDAQQREGLSGDLAAALRGLDGIEDAQVLIAAPRPAAFADEPADPVGAGVRLSLRPGMRLDRGRLDGIRQFVARSVAGLDVAHVAILDDRGAALGATADGDESSELQSSLQSALDEAFGAGATIVRVRVDRDPRAREVRSTRRAPLGGRAIASGTSEERYANDKKRYTRRNAAEDRGSDLREERTEIPAGGVGRISAAVAVDAERGLELAKIRALASATLGLLDGRDRLSVEAVSFARAPPAPAAGWFAVLGFLGTLVPAAIFVGSAIVLVRLGARPLEGLVEAFERRSALSRARDIPGFAPTQVRGVLRDEPPHTAAAIISALPAATATAVLELYPPEERAAIVRRMQRAASPAVPDCETVLRRA